MKTFGSASAKRTLAVAVEFALGLAVGSGLGLCATEAAAENFYGLGSGTRFEAEKGGGSQEIEALRLRQSDAARSVDALFDAVEARAKSGVEQSRAKAALDAQQRAFRSRADRTVFGEAPSIADRTGPSIADMPQAEGNQSGEVRHVVRIKSREKPQLSTAPADASDKGEATQESENERPNFPVRSGPKGFAANTTPQAGVKPKAERLPDGRMRVHTRLGKFGPEATLTVPSSVVTPREPNRIVRYTESGIPVSARRDRLVKKSQEIARRYRDEMQRRIDAGETAPPPKRKTQAEIWAEKNAEVLERRRKYGRETSENFVIAGTTPEQSKLYYRSSTYFTMVDGKTVPVVDAPQEKLPEGWLSKNEFEKAKRDLAREEIEAQLQKTVPAVENGAVRAVRSGDGEEEFAGKKEATEAAPTTDNRFTDTKRQTPKRDRDGESLIRDFFPDVGSVKSVNPVNPSGNADSSPLSSRMFDSEKIAEPSSVDRMFLDSHGIASAFRSLGRTAKTDRSAGVSRTASRWLEDLFSFFSGTAHARDLDSVESLEADRASVQAAPVDIGGIGANKAIGAFNGIAKAIADDRRRIGSEVNAAQQRRKAREADLYGAAASEATACSRCSLDAAERADAIDWAGEFAESMRRTEHFSESNGGTDDAYDLQADGEAPEFTEAGTPEAQALFDAALAVAREAPEIESESDGQKAIDHIVDLMGDPDHPASVLSALRRGLEENPIVLDYVPDAAARLGECSPEDEAAYNDPLGTSTIVFVSFSLGEEELKDLFARNAGKNDTRLVFRGVPEGMRFADGVKRIQALASQFNPMPNVVIDPTLFRDYDVRAVPTVVRIREKPGVVSVRKPGERRVRSGELLASVTGLHSDDWVKRQIAAGRTGDLGEQGAVREILERDLIEAAKERVLQIDWDEKKARAAKRAWANLQYERLPSASIDAVRYIDPTILVEKDILDLNGNAVRKAGERVNPMEMRPFTLALVVFNPLVESEVKIALAQAAALKERHPQVMLLATDMVRDETGWDAYKRLTDRFESHVFLLTPEVRERFALRATPSVVTGDNERKLFVVREIAPDSADLRNEPASEANTGR